jgi:hypothetical protein
MPGPVTLTSEAARQGVGEVMIIPGEPQLAAGASAPADPPVLVDSKVGEINGRAVRVSEILDERHVGERLAAAAKGRTLTENDSRVLQQFQIQAPTGTPMSRALWLNLANALIAIELNTALENELLEGEARASLKPEQQQGLRYLVQEISENARRAEGGSAEALRRHQGGRTSEQFKRTKESEVLINYQISQEIERRVHVSWRDVQLYYERFPAEFHPPPSARFRMIRVPASDTDAVEQVREALAQPGAKFEEVAALPENQWLPDQGGFYADKLFTGGYAQGQFFVEPLNAAARALTPGHWTEPIDFGRDKAWIYLESVTEIHRPLSDRDVQLDIAQKLTANARQAELRRYMTNLKERASFSDIEQMTAELVRIAADRYWPEP